jgi:hypothetical protein
MIAVDILKQAASLIGGDRENTHGPKRKNHDNIAALWTAWLQIRRVPDAPLTAADAAAMMILLKLARSQLGNFNHDDGLDATAYAAIFAELSEE